MLRVALHVHGTVAYKINVTEIFQYLEVKGPQNEIKHSPCFGKRTESIVCPENGTVWNEVKLFFQNPRILHKEINKKNYNKLNWKEKKKKGTKERHSYTKLQGSKDKWVTETGETIFFSDQRSMKGETYRWNNFPHEWKKADITNMRHKSWYWPS